MKGQVIKRDFVSPFEEQMNRSEEKFNEVSRKLYGFENQDPIYSQEFINPSEIKHKIKNNFESNRILNNNKFNSPVAEDLKSLLNLLKSDRNFISSVREGLNKFSNMMKENELNPIGKEDYETVKTNLQDSNDLAGILAIDGKVFAVFAKSINKGNDFVYKMKKTSLACWTKENKLTYLTILVS